MFCNKNDFIGYIYNYNNISKKISVYLPSYKRSLDKKIIESSKENLIVVGTFNPYENKKSLKSLAFKKI